MPSKIMPVFDHKAELAKIPAEPGVYRYFSEEGEIIYVGKAKNLKNRVSSYFVKNHTDRKTRRLVSQIRRIEFTIVHTEFDALLLENQLIKRYQPRFNILLRDDKTYPFIKVVNEAFTTALLPIHGLCIICWTCFENFTRCEPVTSIYRPNLSRQVSTKSAWSITSNAAKALAWGYNRWKNTSKKSRKFIRFLKAK
jgi:hypothetical protein